MLIVVILSVIMLSVVILSVIMLRVVAHKRPHQAVEGVNVLLGPILLIFFEAVINSSKF
jgi:hypothetical protein